jgi:hypothetical protein
MFKPKRAKAENVAAGVAGIPRPVQPQTIHNHAPSEVGRIFAWATVYGVGGVIGWQFLLYLVAEMGYKKPVATLGWILFGLASLLAVSFVANHFILIIRDAVIQVTEIREAARVEEARYKSLAAAQPLPGESRLTEEDSRFAALLRVVMQEAYAHLHEVGQYAHNEAKPWARRANSGRTIPGFKEPVTEAMASRVSTWLLDKAVIDKKGNINDRGYPSFAHFVTLLEEEFYTPIQVQKALSPLLRREVSFTEN